MASDNSQGNMNPPLVDLGNTQSGEDVLIGELQPADIPDLDFDITALLDGEEVAFSVSDERFYLKQKKDTLSGKPVWSLYLRAGSTFETGWDGYVSLVVMVDYAAGTAMLSAPLVFALVVFAEDAAAEIDNLDPGVGETIVSIPYGDAVLNFLHVNGLESALVEGLGGDRGKLDFVPESHAQPIDYDKIDLGALLDNLLDHDGAITRIELSHDDGSLGLEINLPKTLSLENGEQILYFKDLPSQTFSVTLEQDVEIEIIVLAEGGEIFILNKAAEIPLDLENRLRSLGAGDDDPQLLPELTGQVSSGLLSSAEEVLDFFYSLVFVQTISEVPISRSLEFSVVHEQREVVTTALINFEDPDSGPLENDADNFKAEAQVPLINDEEQSGGEANAQKLEIFDDVTQDDLPTPLDSHGADIL